MDHVPSAVLWIARDGSITHVNDQATKLLGFSHDEMLGKSVSQIDLGFLTEPQSLDRYLPPAEDLSEFSTRFAHRDGTEISVEVANRLIEVNGTMMCCAFVRDVSKLKQNQRELRLVSAGMRHSIDATLIAEVDLRDTTKKPKVLYVNDAFKLMSSYDDSVGIENTPAILSGPETSQGLLRLIQDQIDQRQPLRHEILAYTKHGSKFWAELCLSPISGWLDESSYWMIVYRDITNRKLDEKRLAALRDSLKVMVQLFATTDGVWDWDIAQNKVEFQSGYRKLLGYDGDDLIGIPNAMESLGSNIHPDDRERVLTSRRNSLESRTPFEEEFRLRCKDGSYLWVHDRATVIYNESGDPIRMAGSIYDISQRKITEAALDLEREMLKRSNADLEQFAYAASHDLQEPLRAVSGFMELLRQRHSRQLDEQAQGYIKKSIDGAARLNQLITDLLHFSRVTRDESRFVNVDLNVCVANVKKNLERLARETSASIQVEPLPTIMGIESLLMQLLQNLIENGIKYRGENPPTVKVSSNDAGKFVEIRIADNGIGIPPEFHQQVFTLFKRLHHREEYQGTGIGLAICQRVAERHGGSITIEDKQDGGTCFVVRLLKQIESQFL